MLGLSKQTKDQRYMQGRHFSFFQGGGQNFDRLPKGGGAEYEKNKFLCATMSLFFQFRGPCPPPPNDVSGYRWYQK